MSWFTRSTDPSVSPPENQGEAGRWGGGGGGGGGGFGPPTHLPPDPAPSPPRFQVPPLPPICNCRFPPEKGT